MELSSSQREFKRLSTVAWTSESSPSISSNVRQSSRVGCTRATTWCSIGRKCSRSRWALISTWPSMAWSTHLSMNRCSMQIWATCVTEHSRVITAHWASQVNEMHKNTLQRQKSKLLNLVTLKRQMGFYLVDYFMPSMMIVAISWVSFWLQADQTAPRVMLGTTTMLTFITLSSAQDKTLPKVSYINASEIWSMGCTGFIFASLLEFAFSNTIWRRKKTVHLKKVKWMKFEWIWSQIFLFKGQRQKHLQAHRGKADQQADQQADCNGRHLFETVQLNI